MTPVISGVRDSNSLPAFKRALKLTSPNLSGKSHSKYKPEPRFLKVSYFGGGHRGRGHRGGGVRLYFHSYGLFYHATFVCLLS